MIILCGKCIFSSITDKFGNTPLIEAIKGSHTRIVKILQEGGAIFTEPNTGDNLRNGVWNGKLEFVTNLLQSGANPNSSDRDGRTPLHIAVSQGMIAMAKTLIEHGADTHLKDRFVINLALHMINMISAHHIH